jgi:hypothetical protein
MTSDTKAILSALKGIEAAIHTQTGAMYSIESRRGSPISQSTQDTYEKASQLFATKRAKLHAEAKGLLADIQDDTCR